MIKGTLIKDAIGLTRSPTLTPISGVKKGKRSDWEGVDSDPQFLCKTMGWLPGWYNFEFHLSHDRFAATVSIYMDTGQGFNEKQRVDLPLRDGKVSERLVFFPLGIRQIRIDPLSEQSNFSILHCRFVWLRPKDAWEKLYRRLASHCADYLALDKRQVRSAIQERAGKRSQSWKSLALHLYDSTFTMNIQALDYSQWLENCSDGQLSKQEVKVQLKAMDYQPLISILLPVYKSSLVFLQECIESVQAQTYTNWQLCIADDASVDSQLTTYLKGLAEQDPRIIVTFRPENGHISAASNSALDLAEGEFVTLLDHDDCLADNALFHVIEALNQHPDLKLVYTDEDKLDEDGKRCSPHFKADWNPDLLYSHNYICHLCVFEVNHLRKVGGFREGYEGSQDHDLVLRYSRDLKNEQIFHIPKVLYHWRAAEGSTALSSNEKSYTQTAGEKAVHDLLASRKNFSTVVNGLVPNSYRVQWNVPEPAPLVSILVPTRDGIDILEPCIDAVLSKTTYTHFELLILNNQSTCKRTLTYLDEIQQRDSRVKVLSWDYPFNYSAINNFGVEQAKGSIITLLNNDVEPINGDWLTEMVSQAIRPEIGCVGAMLFYPDNTIQHAGVILGIGGVAGHSHKYWHRGDHGYFSRLSLVQNLSAVTGACLVVEKAIFEQVGGLNESDLPISFNDVDLCLKVKTAGFNNLWTPYAELVHHESASRGEDDSPEKVARANAEADYMRATWGALLDNDPAYNPNLTLTFENFSLREH